MSFLDKFIKRDYTNIETFWLRGVEYYWEKIQKLCILNPEYDCAVSAIARIDKLQERIFQYLFTQGKASLIEEPKNENDPNAIAVKSNFTLLGYIPAESCSHIKKNIIHGGNAYSVIYSIYGGNYRVFALDGFVEFDEIPKIKIDIYN